MLLCGSWSVCSNALNMSWMLLKYQTYFRLAVSILRIFQCTHKYGVSNVSVHQPPFNYHSFKRLRSILESIPHCLCLVHWSSSIVHSVNSQQNQYGYSFTICYFHFLLRFGWSCAQRSSPVKYKFNYHFRMKRLQSWWCSWPHCGFFNTEVRT